MIEFLVDGCYAIKSEKNKGIKRITRQTIEEFWLTLPIELQTERGCYVFGIKKSRSVKPFYVGKATTGFAKEIFTSHKLEKYNDVLHKHTFGTPVFYFAKHPSNRGKLNKKAIDEMETYLIQSAIIANEELRNIQKRLLPSWTIRNVINKAPGKSKQCEVDFAKMLKLV